MILQIVAIVLSYLLGSVSFSLLYGKLKGIDIRQHGSGNAGATNTLRVLGKGPAILVLLLDVLKGVIAVLIGHWLGGESTTWLPGLCGIAAIAGHNWPVYFHFRGGKGIATAIGVLASLTLLPALLAGIIAILAIVITRYVSLGSLIFVILTPWILLVLGKEWPFFWIALVICLFAVWRHRTNIVKLVRGNENKLGSKGGDRLV